MCYNAEDVPGPQGKDGNMNKRYWRMPVGLALLMVAAAIGFATHDGTWMLILALAGLAFMVWPVVPWAAAPDPRQYEEELGSKEPETQTSLE